MWLDKHPPSLQIFTPILHVYDTSNAIAMSIRGDIYSEYRVFPDMTYDVIECQRQGPCITINTGRDGILDDAGNVWVNIV